MSTDMNGSRWRQRAAPVVARVLAETKGQPEAVIKAALTAAYPFGQRAYHPHKVWLDEVKRQRGLKPSKARKGTPKRAQQDAEGRTLDLFAPRSGGPCAWGHE